jgi:3-oxoacyl-(acyl-carrier-protein) synthase
MVAPKPGGGEDVARALRDALNMARVAPQELDYFCAHGIGSEDYDIADTEGVRGALGDHAYHIAVSSIKAVTGQAFGASGAMQAVAVCMALETETLPPTINYTTPDERCDLDYVPNVARRARVATAALNAHSYGGAHASLVLGRFRG